MAKNHVANSRGNPFQQDVVGILRALGHVTYDFRLFCNLRKMIYICHVFKV